MTDKLDKDLDEMSRDALLAEARKLRAAVRAHRDSSGHDLCWYHPEMWALLPDTPEQEPNVPAWEKFMKGCAAYRASLDREGAHLTRTTASFDQGEDL